MTFIFSYDDVLSHKVLVDMVHGMSCHCEVSGFQIKREQGPWIDQSCWNSATSRLHLFYAAAV